MILSLGELPQGWPSGHSPHADRSVDDELSSLYDNFEDREMCWIAVVLEQN